MAKCILEHCEFAWGDQCCLACPKKLTKKMERLEVSKRIDDCIERLKRVIELKKHDGGKESHYKLGALPTGICAVGDSQLKAYINYHGRQFQLCTTESLEEAVALRDKAAEAKEKGVFEEWYTNFRAEKEIQNKAKRNEKKG